VSVGVKLRGHMYFWTMLWQMPLIMTVGAHGHGPQEQVAKKLLDVDKDDYDLDCLATMIRLDDRSQKDKTMPKT
jgi:hypothetical protein